jgi:hypothetical protein
MTNHPKEKAIENSSDEHRGRGKFILSGYASGNNV